MSDERDKEGQPQGFKVSDRRKRYEEPASDAPVPAPEPAPEPAAAAPVAQPAEQPPAGDEQPHLGDGHGLDDAGAGPAASPARRTSSS